MWSNFSPCTNDEETINGTYCRNGLFKISGDAKVSQYPCVQAGVENTTKVICIDNCIILLEDENFSNCSFLSFKSKIDNFTISQTGNLIICALSDGDIFGVLIKGKRGFNVSINTEDVRNTQTFNGIHRNGPDYFLTCTSGAVYSLRNIDESVLNIKSNDTSQDSETFNFEETLMANLELERLSQFKGHYDFKCSLFVLRNGSNELQNYTLIAETKNTLHIWNDSELTKLYLPTFYNGIKNIYNLEHYILLLTNSGQLFELCIETNLIFNVFEDSVTDLIEDLIIMENNDNCIEFLILTKPNEHDERFMKLIEFTGFKCIYEVELPKDVWMVRQQKNSVNLYYLSGENYNEFGLPQEIEMKIISETNPDQRLKKLIQKGYLDEAEAFGAQMGLSLQPIYEARAKKLLVLINCANENDVHLINELFSQLMHTLKLIENKDFFLQIRLMEIPNRKLTSQFLEEVLKHLNDKQFSDEVLEIKELQLRMETLNIIDPYECNLDWQKFLHHQNMLKMCTSYLKTDIMIACLIWKRHAASIISHLDQENVIKILNLILPNAELFDVIQWLQHFIPVVTQIYPKTMPHIVKWIITKTRSLQFSNHWPDIGVEFCTDATTIFEDINFLFCDVGRQYESCMEKLRRLVLALQHLSTLKNEFNLTLTLENYIKDSIDETALSVLQRAHINSLQKLVKEFLYPIYMEKGESPVNAIIKYIQFLLANRKGISYWLERAIVCIELLHNEKDKLSCALLILRAAPVPWPETIAPLMKLKNSTHPLAIEISTECELQILKIIKVKYDWPANSNEDNMKLVFRIIKMNRPEMVQDLKDIVNVIPDITTNAYFYICYEYVKKGEIEKGLEFLQVIEEQKRMECYMMLFNIFKRKLEENEDLDYSEYMVEFLKCILNEIKGDDHTEFLIFLDLKLLHNNFNIKVKLQDLMDIRKKEIFLYEGCRYIKNCLNNCSNAVDKAWHGICQLTAALKLEKVLGVIEIAALLNSIHFSCAMSYNLLELDEVSKLNYQYYVDLAILLLIQEINVHIEGHEITDSLTYPLVYNLLIRALQHGKIEHVEIREFLQWVRIASNLYGVSAISEYYKNLNDLEENVKNNLKGNFVTPISSSKKRDSILVFDNVVDKTENAKPISQPIPVVRCLSFCLVLISQELKPINSILIKIGAVLQKSGIVCTDKIKDKFFDSLEHLIKSKQYTSWYMIVQYILQLQRHNGTALLIHSTTVSVQVKKWLHYLLGSKEPNFLDLFSTLICEPDSAVCLEYLDSKIRTGNTRINFFILSEMYYLHFQNWEKVTANRESRMKYFYYSELCKQDFSLKNKPNIEFVSISQIMKELGNKTLDVNLLKRLSIDFDWDYQQVLVTQVSSLLQLQEPNFEIKCDVFGKQELIMKTTVEEIRQLCQPYVREITNTDLLASELQNLMLKEINFYFYELYLCGLDILAYINAFSYEMELWKNILLFLKHKMTTKRRKRASQLETDWWLKSQLEAGVLPKIAKYRIPFIPIVQKDLKVVLDGEVNVDNCVSWFPLIKLHAALEGITSQTEILEKQEHFCMSAVKNSIYEQKQQTEDADDSDEWHLQPLNNAFLQAILRLVRNMVDASKTLFILYFVTHHAPNGADQVEAAFECYNFAIKHEQELMANEKAREIISKIKRKYPIFKTQHLLYLYGLVEDKLLQLVENPKELINALYNHDVVLKTSKPDINKLASEIAELHNLDFSILQLTLLQNWMALSFPTEISDLEETFYEDLNATMPQVDPINDNFVSRVHYILTSWDSEKAMDFLIHHIFPIDDGTINTGKQLQMCECFAKLNNEDNLSYGDIVNQNHYIITKCIHYLKQLGYNYTVDRFKQNDKLTILKKLWQNHANNTHALELMSYICLGFNIYTPQIWNGILKQMVNLNMVKKLESLVEILSCKSNLIPIEGLARAWECVLRTPFKTANRTRSYDQENILHKNLVRIQSCPLVNKLNLIEIAEDCIRLDRCHMAAVLIAFCNENQKDNIKVMLMKRKYTNLKNDIIDLEKAGILPKVTSYVLKFLNL